MTEKKIKIMGKKWKVIFMTEKEDKEGVLYKADGICDDSIRTIYLRDYYHRKREPTDCDDSDHIMRRNIRHEILHAYLDECGLKEDSASANAWARNEEMVDWIANLLPRVNKTLKKMKVI